MPTRILPNQIIAHHTPAHAWAYGKTLIEQYGDQVITEDRKLTKEIQNLHLPILEPLSGWPIAGSGWDMAGLDKYAEQLMSASNPSGFEYTYGERLFAHGELGEQKINQIYYVIWKLKNNPETRRAVAATWLPVHDNYFPEVPCLQIVDFLIRNGKLNLTAFFRSWDVGRAAVPNMYGLAKLQEHVAKKVNVQMGSLTIMAASAHIYIEA